MQTILKTSKHTSSIFSVFFTLSHLSDYGHLRSRCGHYIFARWFLSIFFLFLA